MIEVISINGRIIPAGAPAISPLDRGFTLGDGVFETMKVTVGTPHGTVWYLDRHLKRLERAADRLGITVTSSLRRWIDEVVRHANARGEHGAYALRVTLTRGVAGEPGLAGRTEHSTVVIVASSLPGVPPAVYERGVSALIASTRRNERGATCGLKTTNYLESILMLREAARAGCDDAIALDTRGFVAEASASNIFIWRGDALLTPPLACGILPGITRAVVLDLAALGAPDAEREMTPDDVVRADEAFLTSSLRGIVPLVRVDHCAIGPGTPGLRTRRLMAQYDAVTDRT